MECKVSFFILSLVVHLIRVGHMSYEVFEHVKDLKCSKCVLKVLVRFMDLKLYIWTTTFE